MRNIENLAVEEESRFGSEAWEQARSLLTLAAIGSGLWGWFEFFRGSMYVGSFCVLFSLVVFAITWDALKAFKFTFFSFAPGLLASGSALFLYWFTALPSFYWGHDPSFWLAVHAGAVVEPFWSPLGYLLGQAACFVLPSKQFSLLPGLSGLTLALSFFLVSQEFLSHFKVKKWMVSSLVLLACLTLILSRPFWNAGTMGSGLTASLGFLLLMWQRNLIHSDRRHLNALFLLLGLLWSTHPLWGVLGLFIHGGAYGFSGKEVKKHSIPLLLGLSPYLWVVFRAGRFFPSWGGDHPFLSMLKDRNLLWEAHVQGDWSFVGAMQSFGWASILLLFVTVGFAGVVFFTGHNRQQSARSVFEFWGWVFTAVISVLFYSSSSESLGPVSLWFLAGLARYLLLMIEHKAHDGRSFLRSRRGMMAAASCGMLLACWLACVPGQRYFRGQFFFPEQHALNLTRSLDEKSFLVCDDLFEFDACLEVRMMEPAVKSSVILQKNYLNQRWYVAEFIAHQPELLFSNTTGPIDMILKGFILNNREYWEIHWSRAAIPVDWKEPQAFPSGLTQFFQAQSGAPVDPAKFQYRYDLTALPENSNRLDPQTKGYLSRYTGGFTAMGNKLVEQERYSDAIHAFDRAIRLDPSLDEPRAMLSQIYSERKILEAAELEFERVIKDRPAELANIKAKLTQAQKDKDEAASMRYLDEMIQSNARLADAQYQLSKIYEERGRSQEAKTLLKASVELNPQQIGAQMAMGHYLAKLGKRLEAEQAFRAVLSIDPQNKQAQIEIWKLLNQS